jgi:low temperature requirement protein LtrA
VNFSWFASAYDTDDWVFRLVTMVQMMGVLILALGLPRMFASMERGVRPENAVMVMGYVIMRVALVGQWLRAGLQDPERRRCCLTYAGAIALVQIVWVALIFAPPPAGLAAPAIAALISMEMVIPWFAERKDGGTPWHAHHIAERYSLLAIIALGEGLAGAMAAIAAAVKHGGWNLDTALVTLAGAGLTFGLWWMYFLTPSAEILHVHRWKGFGWGYGHMIIFAAIAATGAGLRVTAAYIAGKAAIAPLTVVLSVAAPLAIYIAAVYGLYSWLVQEAPPFKIGLLTATAGVLALAVALSMAGVSPTRCLLVLTAAPAVTIIGYGLLGRRLGEAALARVLAGAVHGG